MNVKLTPINSITAVSLALFLIGCSPSEEDIQAKRQVETAKIYLDRFNQEITSTSASKRWISNLNINRNNKFGVIYISELQKEWQDVGPIAFVGNIVEVENFDKTSYIIKIKLSSLNSKIFLKNKLFLQCGCGKKEVDKSIKESRDNFKDILREGASVGVIADIGEVSREFLEKSQSDENNSLIGIGECISIFAIPQRYSSFFQSDSKN